MEELILFTNLRALPAGIFDGLTALEDLNIQYSTYLSTLPAGIFDELTVLTSLDLGANRLTTLPADIFDELTLLQYIKPSRQ